MNKIIQVILASLIAFVFGCSPMPINQTISSNPDVTSNLSIQSAPTVPTSQNDFSN